MSWKKHYTRSQRRCVKERAKFPPSPALSTLNLPLKSRHRLAPHATSGQRARNAICASRSGTAS